ncbi:MAG: amidohydrolase [Clostridia bacterium]|nr:amidohydrolase [Clostridia bacterium]
MCEKYDLIIRNATIYTMDQDRRVINRGSLAVRGDRIASIGQEDLTGLYPAGQVIDADGMILLPGFINTHIHIFQSFLKGLGADHRLIEWLNLSALPFGKIMTPRQHELAARLACMEALKSGCTTLCEFFYTDQDPELAYACIEGMQSTGIRSVFIRTFQDTGEEYGMPSVFIEPADKAMREVSLLRKRYKEDDMLSIWTGPDVTWSTTKEGYQTMLEYCLSENVRYSMHLKETEVDNEMCLRTYGKDIVDLLEEIGFLTDRMLAVHCVNLTERDIKRFSEYGVSISHNPAPNLYLGSGIPPIPESLRAGVNVALGTDGAASNNSTDMLETMKLAALIQKGIHRDASVISADQVIRMATCGGAKAIGMENMVGTLEAGKKADMILFDPRHLKSFPDHDAEATVVYASSEENIDTTIVNGKIVYHRGSFAGGLSEAELIRACAAEVEKMRNRIDQ